MNKNHILRTFLLSTVFALLAVVFLTSTVSAHATVPAQGAATSQIPAAVPNVNIVIRHGKAVFSLTELHCKAHGPKKPCFTITNLTNATQQILFTGASGMTSTSLAPASVTNFAPLNPPGVGFFRLKSNPQAFLTVTPT